MRCSPSEDVLKSARTVLKSARPVFLRRLRHCAFDSAVRAALALLALGSALPWPVRLALAALFLWAAVFDAQSVLYALRDLRSLDTLARKRQERQT